MKQSEYIQSKERMINRQLIPRGINNQLVLEAFRAVPREKFLPQNLKSKAYLDRPLPIDEEQTISQPYIVAKMVEALKPKPDDKILDIGTGSGYAAAILAEIVSEVYGIERYQKLADKAQERLEKLNYNNITINVGDGTTGWEAEADYDGILVSAAAPEIPTSLIEQLVIGGYLVIPVGNKNLQQLYQVQKMTDGALNKTKLGKVRFVPLLGAEGWQL